MNAPFVKVEASKFTEVGYVGRDVESMVRDLVEASVKTAKSEKEEEVLHRAAELTEERILDILFPVGKIDFQDDEALQRHERTRGKMRLRLEEGDFEDRMVEVESKSTPMPLMQVVGPIGMDEMTGNIQDMISGLLPKNQKNQKLAVKEAREVIIEQEAEKLIDMDEVINIAINRAEENGIIFIDEIDKIAGTNSGSSPDVSREGVQRDILPIIEGCTVSTKYGQVKTDHILFISAGAFHVSKPSDLIPELQGRFPIRVELNNLTKNDFVKILTQPKNALIKQYQALFNAENVKLEFDKKAIHELARIAFEANERMENIGARRLHTVLVALLEDLLFELPNRNINDVFVTREMVKEKLDDIIGDEDLSRYVL